MNFGINLLSLIKPFCDMTKSQEKKFKYLENEKSIWDEIKSIFHLFQRDFSYQIVLDLRARLKALTLPAIVLHSITSNK